MRRVYHVDTLTGGPSRQTSLKQDTADMGSGQLYIKVRRDDTAKTLIVYIEHRFRGRHITMLAFCGPTLSLAEKRKRCVAF